jgi:hypothetical protein
MVRFLQIFITDELHLKMNTMKTLFYASVFTFFAISGFTCSKSEIDNTCEKVIVTQNGTVCNVWGIRVDEKTVYPSNTIPEQFKQEGLVVCADYKLYEDLRSCACCGGTWADIITMGDSK